MRIVALTYGSIVATVLGFAIWQGWLQADDPRVADDGWRRTTAGWERVELWAAPKDHEFQGNFEFRPQPPESHPRWDVHPGILALGQLLVVIGTFSLCRVARRYGRVARADKGASGSLSESRAGNTKT